MNMELEPEWQGIQEKFQEEMDLSTSQEECAQNERCEYLMQRILERHYEDVEAFKEIKETIHQNGLAIHNLEVQLSQLVDTFNDQQAKDVAKFQQRLYMEDELELQEEHVEEEKIIDEVDAKEVEIALESCVELKNMVCKESSAMGYEDVKSEENLELKRVRPHSLHFSTLFLMVKWKLNHPSRWRNLAMMKKVLTFLSLPFQEGKMTSLT